LGAANLCREGTKMRKITVMLLAGVAFGSVPVRV
jgi:hypothetical protein